MDLLNLDLENEYYCGKWWVFASVYRMLVLSLIIFQSFVKLNEKGDRSGVFEISQLIGMTCIKYNIWNPIAACVRSLKDNVTTGVKLCSYKCLIRFPTPSLSLS